MVVVGGDIITIKEIYDTVIIKDKTGPINIGVKDIDPSASDISDITPTQFTSIIEL